jgi:hypothetical protein
MAGGLHHTVQWDRKFACQLGHDLAKGALGYVCSIWLLVLIVVGVLSVALAPYASTDATDRDARHRSSFTLRTDYGSGCQYLESDKGFLTPRMGGDGRQICGASQ